MRKHFLILMLLALLPLAGWAATKATLRNAPTRISGLRYNTNVQNLIQPITDADYQPDYQINHGGVKFVVKETADDLTPEEKAGATFDLPTGRDSKMYYIHYQVLGDGTSYEDGDWTSLGGVFINKGIISSTSVTAPTGVSGLIYDNEEHALLKSAASCTQSDGAITYSIDNGANWKTDIDDDVFTKKDADNYVIKYKIAEAENWEEYVDFIIVSIGQKSIGDVVAATGFTVNLDDESKTKTFTGSEIDDITEDNVAVTHTTLGNLTKITDYTISLHNATNVPAPGAAYDDKPYVLVSGVGNYGGSVRLDFTINPKNISTGVTVDALDAVAYTGAKVLEADVNTTGKVKFGTIVMTEKENEDDTDYDYTIETGTDFTVATGGKITITGHGNYTGTLEKEFAISKATLKVTPAAGQAKNLGSADPALHFTTVADYGLKGQDAPTGDQTIEQKVNSLITNTAAGGAINVTRAAGESASDTYLLNVALSGTAPVFDNYSIEAVNDPAVYFTINRAGVTITATPAQQTYGYKVPDITGDPTAFTFTAVGLIGAETITSLDFEVTKKNTTTTFVEDDLLNVDTYVVTPSNATATSNSYEFNYVAGEFQVVKKVIKVVAIAKETNYNKDKSAIVDIDLDKDDDVNDTWTDAIVKLCDADGTTAFAPVAEYDGYAAANTYIGWKKFLINTLSWDKEAATIAAPGNIEIGLVDHSANEDFVNNFDIQTVPGRVTWNNDPTSLVLERVAIPNAAAIDAATNTAAAKIEEYDQAEGINVTFTFPGHTMKANTWYSWVLPFNTSVKEISEAFGYAVVDILNENGASKKSDVKFSLYMGDIDAGQPFILKVYQDITPEDFAAGAVKFNGVKIINGSTIDTDANECQFIGTYTGKYGLNGDGTEYLFRLGEQSYSKGGAGSQIRPLGAYIKFAEASPSEAHYIYIEEPDGSTTAISSIAADGEMIPAQGWYTVNGVKLETAPTEKGIYINNGKKIVIK